MVSAPLELQRLVTDHLLGKPHVEKGSPKNLAQFSCWSFVWHYTRLCGILVPFDPFEAEKLYIPAPDGKPQWRDILAYKTMFDSVPHCGVVENEQYVLHCGRYFGSVERDEIFLPPWDRARLMRHKDLL